MEVCFSAKPQILTLTPLSSSTSPYRSSLRSIRREFLGCGHTVRPPGSLLRSRGRQTKPSSHSHSRSSRFLFRASLGSHSVLVVVAVVTVSAASIVYWNFFKSKKNAREVRGPANFALPQMGGNVVNHVIRSQMHDFGDVREVEVQQLLKDENRENSHASVEKEAPLQFHNAALMNKETLVTSGSGVLVSGAGNSTFLNESSVFDQSISPLLSESAILEPLHLPESLNGLQIDKLREEIESAESEFGSASVQVNGSVRLQEDSVSDSGLHVVTDPSKLNGHLVAELHGHETEKRELGEEGEITSYSFLLGESERKDLHMFYEKSKLDRKIIAKINGHKSFSPDASVLDSKTLSASFKDTILKGGEVSARIPPLKADTHEAKIPFSSKIESPLHSGKDSGKVRGYPKDLRKGLLAQNNDKVLPKLPRLNGLEVGGKHHHSEQISSYNRLLEDGRLSEAVEVLEDMERRGFLDMNKVYHAKFFRICKIQKAVNEAFRFTNLIPNPTLSTYNMLMSVCASSQDSYGAFKVMQLVQEAGLKADCKLYTTLISTCAKSCKVDSMFEVFHKMLNDGVEPNVHTYGSLIDGCARAGQVAKAFGAYGIMRSKNVKPDRVVFNALISACGQAGAVDRGFDVLAEMTAEPELIDPDHITVGALMKACANSGQVDRAREVYKMMHKYNIKGTPEVYTIAVNSSSHTGDWEFARNVYEDMTRKGVLPDEMFLSALIDAAGHAGKLDAAFQILREARNQGVKVGTVSYSSLMGACSNAKNWQKALELYEDLKSTKSEQTVSTVNALITALCDGDQLQKAMDVLSEMRALGLSPNSITYSILLVASEKKGDLEVGLMLLSQAKKDGISPTLVMSRCVLGMCLRRYEKASTLGEPILSFDPGQSQIVNEWTSSALMVYREMIAAGVTPTIDILSQVLGCLQLPYDASFKNRLIENLGVSADTSRPSNLSSLIDGFGEYDPRAFTLLEEAASLGIISCVSFKQSPVIVDTRELQIHTAEVYLLTVLKGLKHRLAAGARLPSITILLPVEKAQLTSPKEEKTINLAGRVGQAVAALLRRLGLRYQGNESYGKIRINGLTLKRWFKPKLASPFSGRPEEINLLQFRLGKGIAHQQRNIRIGDLSLD